MIIMFIYMYECNFKLNFSAKENGNYVRHCVSI